MIACFISVVIERVASGVLLVQDVRCLPKDHTLMSDNSAAHRATSLIYSSESKELYSKKETTCLSDSSTYLYMQAHLEVHNSWFEAINLYFISILGHFWASLCFKDAGFFFFFFFFTFSPISF